MEPISVIITTKNECLVIGTLLDSLQNQTLLPAEVMIVDGGSSDDTYTIVSQWKPKNIAVVHKQKLCNRAQGRNMGVTLASSDLLAFTDAGCRPDEHWLERLAAAKHSVFVGGVTLLESSATRKQQLISQFMLPRSVSLPATRSLLLRREVWRTAGGFPEYVELSEDYIFANKVTRLGIKPQIVQNAVVYWLPPPSYKTFFKTVYSMARDDVKGHVVRARALTIPARYIVFLLSFLISPFFGVGLLVSYVAWASLKSRRLMLPTWRDAATLCALQGVTDLMVIFGLLVGSASLLKGKHVS